MQLSKIISPERVRVPLAATVKEEVITELIDLLAQTGAIEDRAVALEAVLKRESERSTGIGFGLAIPHGKTSAAREVVMAAGKPAQPVEFRSVDKRPVTFVVLLVSPPDQTGAHIQALAKISRLMNGEGFRAAIDRASSAAELHAAIAQFEQAD